MKKLFLLLLFLSSVPAFAQISVSVNSTVMTNGGTLDLGVQSGATTTLTIVITNTGANDMYFADDNGDSHLFNLSGNAAAECSINEGNLQLGISAGMSKTVTITYTPATSGNRVIAIEIPYTYIGNQTFSFSVVSNQTVTTTQQSQSTMFYLAPNPFSDRANIVLTNHSEESCEITVSTVSGKMMEQYTMPAQQGTISLGSSLPAGLYVVTIKTATGLAIQKIIKE